jgi:hypothetical protein
MDKAYALTRWNLADLFTSQEGPEIQAAFDELQAKVAAFESHRRLSRNLRIRFLGSCASWRTLTAWRTASSPTPA